MRQLKFKTFTASYFWIFTAQLEQMHQQVAEFATQIGKERLVTITSWARWTFVYYWE